MASAASAASASAASASASGFGSSSAAPGGRIQNVPPAAIALQASLASSDAAACNAPLTNVRAWANTAGFMFTARRAKPKRDSYSGIVAMLDDFFPVSCVLRKHGCWPKKKRQSG
ncbi:NaCP60E [Symbiodinium sp. KB8]|nr:NaCP60E [Symbiodinium sp. KB8]